VEILILDGILRLVSGNVDEGERLAQW
jgi:hypothetical protein